MAPKVKGVENLRKQTIECIRSVPKHPKKNLYVVLLLLKFQKDL
jgi:hypothetical protein